MNKQTLAGAYDRLAAHERECAVRYKALEDTLSDQGGELSSIKDGIRWVIKGVAAIGLSLIVWLAVQLYGYVQRDIERNRQAAASAMSQRVAPVETVAPSH